MFGPGYAHAAHVSGGIRRFLNPATRGREPRLLVASPIAGIYCTSRTSTQSSFPGPSALFPGELKRRVPALANGEPEMVVNVPAAGSFQPSRQLPALSR